MTLIAIVGCDKGEEEGEGRTALCREEQGPMAPDSLNSRLVNTYMRREGGKRRGLVEGPRKRWVEDLEVGAFQRGGIIEVMFFLSVDDVYLACRCLFWCCGPYLECGGEAHLEVSSIHGGLGGELLEHPQQRLLEHRLQYHEAEGSSMRRRGRRGAGETASYRWSNHCPVWEGCVLCVTCPKESASTMRPPVFSTHTFISIMPTYTTHTQTDTRGRRT